MKTVAIIPAGGAGKRLKSRVAKQFLLLDDFPVIVHTLKVFQESEHIDGIIVALPPDEIIHARKELLEKYGINKVTDIIAGGNERQDSVKNCLESVQKYTDIVLIHDAVRPFVTEEIIRNIIEIALTYGSATTGVRVNDTLKELKAGHIVSKTVPRDNLWLTQTPQAFQVDIIKEAYRRAYEENFYGTDDASLVERIGKEVKMVQGSYANIKITTEEDLLIAEALIQRRKDGGFRTGMGYDSHKFTENRKLILGGVEISFEKGLDGHSDADALLHAICDALLGAAAQGDIGKHFPDNDSQYKDISSMILLEKVQKIVEHNNYFIHHVDATVIMEAPKLVPYSAAIVANIARILKISENSVNIKGKTNEGMGFAGRGEGVAVFAVATLGERKKDVKKA